MIKLISLTNSCSYTSFILIIIIILITNHSFWRNFEDGAKNDISVNNYFDMSNFDCVIQEEKKI